MRSYIVTDNIYLRLGLTFLAEQCNYDVNIIVADNDHYFNEIEADDLVIFHMCITRPSSFSLMTRLSGRAKLILISSSNIKFDAMSSVSEIVRENVSINYFNSLLNKTKKHHPFRKKIITRLTLREKLVLDCFLSGENASYIADRLGISAKTIYAHKLNALRKLDARNPQDLLFLITLFSQRENTSTSFSGPSPWAHGEVRAL